MRLLKVHLQAVYVDDVDGDLVEVAAPPVVCTAAQWKALDPAAFDADMVAHLTETPDDQ